MKDLSNPILERAGECFGKIRKNLLEGAALLHKIFNEKLYEGAYSTFEEYVQEVCQIKPSFASKLIAVHDYWIVENSVSPLKLAGVDMEKLYLARKLGSPEKALVKAMTLSRDDLKAELREERGECVTHVPVTFCAHCRVRIL